MSFLDERDDPPRAARPRRPPPSGPSADPQTLLVRRIIAGVGAALVLFLLFLGIRGCMASQKEQSFKDYVRDASELVGESQQQSVQLFDLLQNPGGSEVDFGSNVNGLRVTAEQLVERAEDADAPDELAPAHERLVQTLELRRDGLAGIATAIADTGGGEGSGGPAEVAAQMQFFLASDVLYSQRFLPRLLGAIEEEGLDQDVPVPDNVRDADAINFLPDIEWLRTPTVRDRLAGIGGGGGDEAAEPGLHGTGLGSVTVQPAGVALVEGTATPLTYSPDLAFDIEIANQGEHPEEEIVVRIEITGPGDPIELSETLDAIEAGETKVVSVPLPETPPVGEPVTINVVIEPVAGEEMTENNEGTFQAIFSS